MLGEVLHPRWSSTWHAVRYRTFGGDAESGLAGAVLDPQQRGERRVACRDVLRVRLKHSCWAPLPLASMASLLSVAVVSKNEASGA